MKRWTGFLSMAGGVIAATVACGSAQAVTTLTLTSTPDPDSYQVSEQTPCIIGDYASKNDAGGCSPKKNNIGGDYLPVTAVYASGGGAFQEFRNDVGNPLTALQYTVADFAEFLVFGVAIDQNSNVQTEQETDVLIWFRVYLDGVLSYEFFDEDGAIISSINNGTGYSDYLLSQIDLRGLDSATRVVFDAKWRSGDGNDYFFIIPEGTPTVPEPGTLALLGLGMLGLGLARRRKLAA